MQQWSIVPVKESSKKNEYTDFAVRSEANKKVIWRVNKKIYEQWHMFEQLQDKKSQKWIATSRDHSDYHVHNFYVRHDSLLRFTTSNHLNF